MNSYLKPNVNVSKHCFAGLRQKGLPWQGQNLAFARTDAAATVDKYVGPQHIAVLGGGITGLVTAFYLAKGLPSAKVTLFNATKELGGWLQSGWVDVGTGKVLFEQGPRTLRPAPISGWVTLQLVGYILLPCTFPPVKAL